MPLPARLLPTTVVGSYPQPDWLVNRPLLSKVVPRTRMAFGCTRPSDTFNVNIFWWLFVEPYVVQSCGLPCFTSFLDRKSVV